MTYSRSPAGLAGLPPEASEPRRYTDPARQDAALRAVARAVRETGVPNPIAAYAFRTDLQSLLQITGNTVCFASDGAPVGEDSPRLSEHFGLSARNLRHLFVWACRARTAEEVAEYIHEFAIGREIERATAEGRL